MEFEHQLRQPEQRLSSEANLKIMVMIEKREKQRKVSRNKRTKQTQITDFFQIKINQRSRKNVSANIFNLSQKNKGVIIQVFQNQETKLGDSLNCQTEMQDKQSQICDQLSTLMKSMKTLVIFQQTT